MLMAEGRSFHGAVVAVRDVLARLTAGVACAEDLYRVSLAERPCASSLIPVGEMAVRRQPATIDPSLTQAPFGASLLRMKARE